MHRYAFSILKNNEEANDIVQFAFMKLWEKKNVLHARQASQYYLYKIVYNQCLNNIRNKKLQQEKNKYYAQQFNETAMQIIDKDVTSRVNAAIHKLPSKCREVFMKSRFEGKKYADIATELKISLKTVEAQMTKALKNLRVSLSDLLDK